MRSVAKCLSLCVIATASIFITAHSQAQTKHGTVNIFVSNGTDLVAVVDSMLTTDTGRHTPSGTKLFQLDDKTILTIAGLYENQGPRQLDSLDAWVPAIASEVATRFKRNPNPHAFSSFPDKVRFVLHTFQFELTTNLQSLAAADKTVDLNYPGLELIRK
jgi:hypothetical protein